MSTLIRDLAQSVTPPDQPNQRRRPIGEAELTALLDIARAAPSGINGQRWRFVIVGDAARRGRLAAAVPDELAATVRDAAKVVVVCGVPDRISRRDLGIPFAAIDVSNALSHLLLAATAAEVPHAWTRTVAEDRCRRELGVPPDVRLAALVALG